MEEQVIEPPTNCQRFRKFLVSDKFKLYCSYFLSSWSDRMWSFALGIALGVIGGDLQYTAASGLVNSVSVLLFASVIGRWVDKTPRLKAARRALQINNLSVASSAAIFVLVLFFSAKIAKVWSGALWIIMIATSIVLCAVGELANCATKICITKDWVVVICGSNREKLAEVNSMMVRIDMASMVLSPMIAGQLMASFGVGWGCAFIGIWNVVSFFLEYFMLWAVYKSCPALATKLREAAAAAEEHADVAEGSDIAVSIALVDNQLTDFPPSADAAPAADRSDRCALFFAALKSGLSSLVGGYRTYFRQSVLPAGLALSSLYLTVLSFDGITTVYILSYGLAENLIALCNGVGAIMGIMGSLVYPRMHRKLGVNRTGLIALTLEWSCLLLPVASIWLPGSNFDPAAVFGWKPRIPSSNCTQNMESWSRNASTDFGPGANEVPISCNNGTAADAESGYGSKCSLAVFITGIVLSRMGLWMADLSISQTFQEHIAEYERGVVNGVQSSLNNVMSIVKSVLVIIFPDPRTFGILIVVSWLAVFAGYCSYCYYSRTVRGHLMPFHKHFKACVAKPPEADSSAEGRAVGQETSATPEEGSRVEQVHYWTDERF